MTSVKNQLNFNSLLITVVGGLLLLGVRKLDEINTKTISLTTSQGTIVERLTRLEDQMVSRKEFRAEIERLDGKFARTP